MPVQPRNWKNMAQFGGSLTPKAIEFLDELEGDLQSIAGVTTYELELQNGFENFGQGWAPATARVQGGFVSIEGLITRSEPLDESGLVIATLPSEAVRADAVLFGAPCDGGAWARVDIWSDALRFQGFLLGGPSIVFLSLSQITYGLPAEE